MKLPANEEVLTPEKRQICGPRRLDCTLPFLIIIPSMTGVTDTIEAPMSITSAEAFPAENLTKKLELCCIL